MGLIKVPRRRIRANFFPDFPVKPSAHWRSRGMVALFDAKQARELVSGDRATNISSLVAAGTMGRSADFSGTANQQYAHRPAYAITDAITIVVIGEIDALASYTALISKEATTTTNMPYELRLGSVSDGSEIHFIRASGANFTAISTGANRVSAGFRGMIAVRAPSGNFAATSGGAAFVSSNKFALSTEAGGSGPGIVPADSGAPVWIGRRSDGATQLDGRIYYVALFNRDLTDVELFDIYARSTSLVEPANDTIWIPVSAGAPAGTTYNVSIAETASAVDTLSAILAAIASVAEAGTALDASSAVITATANVAETGIASDTSSAALTTSASVAESGSATDSTSTGGATTSASITETGAAAETTGAALIGTASVAETAVAADSTSAIATFLASVAEIGAAVDGQSATAVLNAAWSDVLNAADSQNWGGSVISVSLSEALNALDSQSASTVFAASVAEGGAALDATSCVLIANASISEVLAALDSTSVQLITSASIVEALSALDTTSVVNLNFIAAKEHILMGRERSTVLVGRERVTVLIGKERILVIY